MAAATALWTPAAASGEFGGSAMGTGVRETKETSTGIWPGNQAAPWKDSVSIQRGRFVTSTPRPLTADKKDRAGVPVLGPGGRLVDSAPAATVPAVGGAVATAVGKAVGEAAAKTVVEASAEAAAEVTGTRQAIVVQGGAAVSATAAAPSLPFDPATSWPEPLFPVDPTRRESKDRLALPVYAERARLTPRQQQWVHDRYVDKRTWPQMAPMTPRFDEERWTADVTAIRKARGELQALYMRNCAANSHDCQDAALYAQSLRQLTRSLLAFSDNIRRQYNGTERVENWIETAYGLAYSYAMRLPVCDLRKGAASGLVSRPKATGAQERTAQSEAALLSNSWASSPGVIERYQRVQKMQRRKHEKERLQRQRPLPGDPAAPLKTDTKEVQASVLAMAATAPTATAVIGQAHRATEATGAIAAIPAKDKAGSPESQVGAADKEHKGKHKKKKRRGPEETAAQRADRKLAASLSDTGAGALGGVSAEGKRAATVAAVAAAAAIADTAETKTTTTTIGPAAAALPGLAHPGRAPAAEATLGRKQTVEVPKRPRASHITQTVHDDLMLVYQCAVGARAWEMAAHAADICSKYYRRSAHQPDLETADKWHSLSDTHMSQARRQSTQAHQRPVRLVVPSSGDPETDHVMHLGLQRTLDHYQILEPFLSALLVAGPPLGTSVAGKVLMHSDPGDAGHPWSVHLVPRPPVERPAIGQRYRTTEAAKCPVAHGQWDAVVGPEGIGHGTVLFTGEVEDIASVPPGRCDRCGRLLTGIRLPRDLEVQVTGSPEAAKASCPTPDAGPSASASFSTGPRSKEAPPLRISSPYNCEYCEARWCSLACQKAGRASTHQRPLCGSGATRKLAEAWERSGHETSAAEFLLLLREAVRILRHPDYPLQPSTRARWHAAFADPTVPLAMDTMARIMRYRTFVDLLGLQNNPLLDLPWFEAHWEYLRCHVIRCPWGAVLPPPEVSLLARTADPREANVIVELFPGRPAYADKRSDERDSLLLSDVIRLRVAQAAAADLARRKAKSDRSGHTGAQCYDRLRRMAETPGTPDPSGQVQDAEDPSRLPGKPYIVIREARPIRPGEQLTWCPGPALPGAGEAPSKATQVPLLARVHHHIKVGQQLTEWYNALRTSTSGLVTLANLFGLRDHMIQLCLDYLG